MAPNVNMSPQDLAEMTNEVLADYAEKVDKGIITWEKEGNVAVLVHKRFNAAQKELDPVRIPFSSQQIEKIKIDRASAKLQLRRQIVELEEREQMMEMEDAQLYDQLKQDVEATCAS